MISFLIGLFLLVPLASKGPTCSEPLNNTDLQSVIVELDQTLDNFFALQLKGDLELFVAGVRHAARARLLLEQMLGEDIDQLGMDESGDTDYRLRLIAKRVQDLSGNAGKELWIQDVDNKQAAMLRLSELEVMVQHLKRCQKMGDN